jgi:hypothetical protein
MSVSAQDPVPPPDAREFSMVLGGPLFQLIRKARLSDDALDLLRRRVIVISVIAWAPLLLLSAFGQARPGAPVELTFLRDIEVHARFLLALPLLILAELVVHQRTRRVVQQFMDRELISAVSRNRFDRAMGSAIRLRNSVFAELTLVALVYLVGVLYLWPHFVALNVPTWYAIPTGGGRQLSPAGWWYLLVSLPAFQFILLRWYFRIFIWIRFLWQVSRCELRLVPTHPDRVAGLGFLSATPNAFAPLLAAHGVTLAGVIANQIFFHGARLTDFKIEVAAVLVFLLAIVLAPLLIFVPTLSRTKRAGLQEYGSLAQRYVRQFENKWLRGAPNGESLLGSADIQSLADLGNSFEIVRTIRVIPVTRDALVQLTVITVLPIAPLVLTMIPLEDLVRRLLQVVI